MSHFYYQVFKRIQSQLSAIRVFYLQTIQQLLYAWIVFSLFDLFKIVKNHSDPGRYFLINSLYSSLHERYQSM